MRRFIVLTTAVFLASCANPVTVQQAQQTATTVVAAAKQVQAYAVRYCQYEPILASVISLVNASAGMTVDAIGGTLCNAATSIPLADGGTRKIVVNGVVIKGRRIVTVLR